MPHLWGSCRLWPHWSGCMLSMHLGMYIPASVTNYEWTWMYVTIYIDVWWLISFSPLAGAIAECSLSQNECVCVGATYYNTSYCMINKSQGRSLPAGVISYLHTLPVACGITTADRWGSCQVWLMSDEVDREKHTGVATLCLPTILVVVTGAPNSNHLKVWKVKSPLTLQTLAASQSSGTYCPSLDCWQVFDHAP